MNLVYLQQIWNSSLQSASLLCGNFFTLAYVRVKSGSGTPLSSICTHCLSFCLNSAEISFDAKLVHSLKIRKSRHHYIFLFSRKFKLKSTTTQILCFVIFGADTDAKSSTNLLWTVWSPAALSFISSLAYFFAAVNMKSKYHFLQETGRKSGCLRSLRVLVQVVCYSKCACRSWYMHTYSMSLHLSALVSDYVCVCRPTQICNYKGETISHFFPLLRELTANYRASGASNCHLKQPYGGRQ